MSVKSTLRFWGIHGCITLAFWLGLLGLAIWWGGKEYGLW